MHTVHGIVIVVAAQVGHGITTVVVMGTAGVIEVVELALASCEAGVVDTDVVLGIVVDVAVAVGATELAGVVELLATDAALAGVELAGQVVLPTPLAGFFVGMPGIFNTVPIHSLSQLIPGLAFSSSAKVMPKLSAILTP